jgi:hypothetical protein
MGFFTLDSNRDYGWRLSFRETDTRKLKIYKFIPAVRSSQQALMKGMAMFKNRNMSRV